MLSRKFLVPISMAALAAAAPMNEPATIEKRGGSCTGGPWASDAIVIPASSGKGTPFCESGWNPSLVPVTGVTAWTSAYYCTGIQFEYADGTTGPVIGHVSNEYHPRKLTVNYALGDKFTHATLYGPPNNGELAHLMMHTNTGEHLDCGESVGTYEPTAHDQDVASGVLLGAQGTASNKIESLGFLFLRSDVTSIDVTNFNFPDGPTGSQNINPQTLANGHFFNSQQTQNSSWTFTDSKAVATSQTFTQTSTSTFSNTVSVSITAMIPMILSATAGTSFTWTTGEMFADATATTDTTTITWAESGSLLPQTGIDAAAIVGEGAGTFPYSSDVTLNLADGTSVSFPEDGSLKFSDVSQAIVVVTTDNSP